MIDVRSHAVPLLTATLAAAVPLLAAPRPAFAQEGQIVAEVEIRGTQKTNPLAARLAATSAGIKEGQPFKSDALAAARQRIREVGLYGAVTGRTETTPDGKLRVIFEVTENAVISQIVITGNKSIPSEELLPLLETKASNVLNTTTLDQDLLKIQRYYQDKGFRAFVTNEIGIDPKTGILTIPIQETIVEEITIEGLRKTRPYVVTREMKTKPGEPLNLTVLQRDLGRIYNLNLFSDVQNARFEDGSDLGRVKIAIPVQEQRTGQVGVVFGYSVRQRLTGTLELADTNFRGRGQAVNLAWTVGGISSRNQFDIGFTEPWLDKNNTSLSVNLYNRFAFRFNRVLANTATLGTNDDPYFEERQGLSIALGRPLSEFTRVVLGLRTEAVRANNLEANYDTLTPEQIDLIRGALVQDGNVSSMTLRSITNTRDNELDPATGFFFAPSLELGTGSFNYQDPRSNPDYNPALPISDANRKYFVDTRNQRGAFTKANIDLRRYISLDGKRTESLRQPKKVIALRMLAGTAVGNIGFSEQYFIGGADNLRGYADDRFWGNNLFLASAELRVPLDRKSGTISGVLFADVGDAWSASDLNREEIPGFSQHKGFRPNFGFGFGLRIKTPVGPVRLDYGIGETNRTHFAIGQSF